MVQEGHTEQINLEKKSNKRSIKDASLLLFINVYTKNQKPTKYVNLIIKYFEFSKTIYLGKKLDLNLLLADNNKKVNTFNQSLIELLKPTLLAICSTLKNKFEFIDLKISLDLLLDKKFESNKTENTFSSYLKQFE